MTAMFEKLKSYHSPWSAEVSCSFAVAPTVQAIIVDRVTIVNPKLASIIRNKAESVMSMPVESGPSSPPSSKMIASSKTTPSATCVSVIHIMFPASHVWLATVKILAVTSLTKVKSILHEKTVAVSCTIASVASCT
jgi:hypothetical protein